MRTGLPCGASQVPDFTDTTEVRFKLMMVAVTGDLRVSWLRVRMLALNESSYGGLYYKHKLTTADGWRGVASKARGSAIRFVTAGGTTSMTAFRGARLSGRFSVVVDLLKLGSGTICVDGGTYTETMLRRWPPIKHPLP